VVGQNPGIVSMNARGEMLASIRSARAGAALVEPARAYRASGEHDPGSDALLDLLEDRLLDYQAAVRRSDDAGLRAAVAEALDQALAATGAKGPVLLPPELPSEWAPDGRADDGMLTATELDGYAAVVTACRVACAETGTIVLDGEPDQGRRAITLVPDVHVCVVRADQVVHSVPEMMARLDAVRPTTFISGPSATSDIELDRVEGVHGPRTLSVVLVT
jgi:L-lactate dehydrogenase complex protein LldG